MIQKQWLSIIICTYNNEKTIEGTLECVFREKDVEKEVIIVDDASTDNTISFCRRFKVRIIQLEHNRGPAYCRNIGARSSSCDIIFWIDADVRFDKGLFSTILRIMEEHPEVAGVGTISSPKPINKGFFPRYYALKTYDTTSELFKQNKIVIIAAVCARCGSIRRSIFEEMGGFDESFRSPSLEDFELGSRMEGKYGILWNLELVNYTFFRDSFSKIFKYYFIDGYFLGQLVLYRRIKHLYAFSRDARVCVVIILFFCFLILSLIFRPFIIIAGLLYIFVLFEKGNYLKLLYKSGNFFFSLRCWFFYFIFSVSPALGFLCAFFSKHRFQKKEIKL